ncbi:MAG: hypothetical protein C4542_06000 [Dehalococcoidia bacterium]|nr:MAG: hypothetical protein C4542_06000 [Dehalococcoidia bacterium]
MKLILLLVALTTLSCILIFNSVPIAAGSFPLVQITPEYVDFGSQEVGQPSSAVSLTVANLPGGTFTLVVPDLYIEGPNSASFSIIDDNVKHRAIDNGTSATLGLVFKPVSNGAQDATLVIITNAGIDLSEVKFKVPLTGVGTGGVPIISTTPISPSPTPGTSLYTTGQNQPSSSEGSQADKTVPSQVASNPESAPATTASEQGDKQTVVIILLVLTVTALVTGLLIILRRNKG